MTATIDAGGRWPEPELGQTVVVLLGVAHLANPGNDEFNLEIDDVLADDRQRELEALAERLAAWNPDRVAVEWPRGRQGTVDEAYATYRDGGLADPPGDLERRNEVVQIGFRVAARLGHERVAAVDHELPMDVHLGEDEDVPLGGFPTPESVGYPLVDPEAEMREQRERLATGTVPEFLAYLNREPALKTNGALTFAAGFHADGEDHPGARLATAWYERNLRIAENLWRALDADVERVLLPIGSAHVRPLRHLLDEAPMFCPASPLGLLSD